MRSAKTQTPIFVERTLDLHAPAFPTVTPRQQDLGLFAEIRRTPFPAGAFEDLENLAVRLARETDLPGEKLSIGLVGSITLDYLEDHLRLGLVRWGFAPMFQKAAFGTLVPSLMSGPLPAADLVVFIPSERDLMYVPPLGCTAEEADAAVKSEIEFWSGLLGRASAPAVWMNFDLPSTRIIDEADGLLPGGRGWHVRMVNLGLARCLPRHIAVIDTEALQCRIGRTRWPDARTFFLCKQPFAMSALPEVAATLAATIAAMRGKARKVLVMDLDNTLWGGVVGDDGVQGIELGRESPEGEAFVALQHYARQLAARGVVLAVNSKNCLKPRSSRFARTRRWCFKRLISLVLSPTFRTKPQTCVT